jgi:hypothetical protein
LDFPPNRAIPGKVLSGFPSGIARKQADGAAQGFNEKLNHSKLISVFGIDPEQMSLMAIRH